MEDAKKKMRLAKQGKRVEILKALYAGGSIDYKILKLFADTPIDLVQRKVHEMEKEGQVKINKDEYGKRIKLGEDWENTYDQYKSLLKEEYYSRACMISDEIRRSATDGKREEAMAKKGSVNTLMHIAGVGSYPDEKESLDNDVLRINKAEYYSCDEVKKNVRYNVTKEKNSDGSTKIINSRIAGLLLSNDDAYVTYNIGDKLIEWERFGEVRMATQVNKMLAIKHEHSNKVDGLLLADDMDTFIKVVMNEYTNSTRAYKKNICLNIDYAYDRMYALPIDDNGIKMLGLMQRKGWRNELRRNFLEGMELNPRGSVPCDAMDGETYIDLFCIPDIQKLKVFIKRAQYENDPTKYIIYCFDYQTEFVKKLAGDTVQIYDTPIKDYIVQI